MADCSDSRKNTKFIRTIKGPKLQSWIWCVIIQCFISIPCIISTCLGVDITVAVFPEGDVRIKYGDPLEIFCIAENYSSADLQFSLGGEVHDSEIVNSTTRRLYISKPEKQLNTFYCRNIKTGKICVSRILVDTEPEPVTNFNCISKNLDILNCSWTSPHQFSKVNYTVTFSINDNIVQPPCVAPETLLSDSKYCAWNTSSQPRYRQQEEIQFFYLTAENVFGKTYQNFTIDHFSIVKPDPPKDLKVVENGTHSVTLKWTIPNNIFDFLSCGIDHIIEYQIAKIDNTTYFHRVDASSLSPKNISYRFTLTNLPYAHMQYEVRVYIKSKKAVKKEFWSNFSYIVFYTLSERPKRPPDITAGAFDQSTFNNGRVIYVYWKQLEEYEEAGANFTYKVIVREENTNKVQTLFPDKNKSLSYLILNESLNALDVTVYSFNSMGSSVNSSHLYIPRENDTHSLKLTSFTKLAYENGTYELSWVGIKNIDNYTLFWCHHNTTNICSGRMDFAVLDPNKTSHTIDLPREYRYQFAISANVGAKTSGMVWARCDISKEGFVMYRFPVKLNYDVPGNSSVTLRWEMECALQDGIVSGYNITYCPIVQTSSECDKSVNTSYVYVTNPKKMYVTIENLWPFKTYQFTIALITIYGQKNIENATAVLTTSEGTPTHPINVEITNVRNDSLVISWDPPTHKNGNIGKYLIYKNDEELPFYVDEMTNGIETSRRNVTLKGLRSFTNYTFLVQACNVPISLCSVKSSSQNVFVRTRIGPPSKMKLPSVKYKTGLLKWDPPEYIGAESVALYQVRRIRDDMAPEILNTTELTSPLIQCEGSISTVSYEVRAITFDEDLFHGVIYDKNVTPPIRKHKGVIEYPGEWSDPPNVVGCRNKDSLTMIFIFTGIFAVIGLIYFSIKFYKKYKKMEDIKPVLPSGLGIPEKDISKYAFGGWNPNNKEEKPPSDEMLLLPNSKTVPTSTDVTKKVENFGSNEQTDSTAVLDSRREVDGQVSTSDDGSDSSLNLDADPVKGEGQNLDKDDDFSTVDTDSTYLSDHNLKKNPTSNYVQTVINPSSNYVQSTPSPSKNLPQSTSVTPQPASSSYVMAALQPPVFPMGLSTVAKNPVISSSGYCAHPDMTSKINFPKLSPSKLIDPEALPTTPSLPPPAKINADNSYIQLQSLDSLPSLKPNVCNTVPLKPPASSGYVSHGDVVINKHLNNMLIADQLGEESAILDPAMSPDAYCRFSWNTDPANDNLHSLLAESPLRTSKN